MQVSKWGNSLAIRLPKAVVDALGLKEGDEIEVTVAGTRSVAVSLDRSRERAIAELKASKIKLPAGFKFDRDEANER